MSTFVDDECVPGPDKALTWQASQMLVAKQAYLGISDASRKARPCTPALGAWSGSAVHVVEKLGVCALTLEEKWYRIKAILDK